VKPFEIRHVVDIVSVLNAEVRAGMASNGRSISFRNNEDSMSIVRFARVFVVDENITSLDVVWGRLIITASASPAVVVGETVAKVLCTDFLLAARIATAWATLIQVLVTTSDEALAHKVGAIAAVAAVAAHFTAKVRIGSAIIIVAVAVMVGAIPPLLGVLNGSLTIVGSSSTEQTNKTKQNKSLHSSDKNAHKKKFKKKNEPVKFT